MMLDLCIVVGLGAIAVYVLAILLRVSCHFCRATIPALGRAYFTVALSIGLTLVAGYFILAFTERAWGYYAPLNTWSAALLTFLANGIISTVAYAPLLEVRFGTAFNVWLVQA